MTISTTSSDEFVYSLFKPDCRQIPQGGLSGLTDITTIHASRSRRVVWRAMHSHAEPAKDSLTLVIHPSG
ncbi:hypothetical protein GSI_00074 [Ganoderma sinense ZZ0214-1]|uniref:Uncharacterized protein n=1 Tax=Ganoderma sinense ZZ0214-1 TaxID=1077348 RepID=A0A2G8SRI9_9APHY|nr:hypothetical protein GSI_00074 [Ganoderma sinense ZZ0214-1]